MALATTLTPGRPGRARSRAERDFRVFARLQPGVTIAQAHAEPGTRHRQRLETAHPDTNADRRMTAAFEETVRRRMPARLGLVALTAVSLILLTACANVAGLLIGRGEARRAEIAIRLALGAGRARIVRQLLVEGAVLALMAAAASTLLTYWVIRLVPAMVPAMPITMNLDFQIDLRVLAFTLLVAMIAVPVFALAPALVASRPDLTPVLKGESARLGRWRWLTLRNALVVGQISLSLALLVSSGLFVRSLSASRAIDPGFRPRPMLFSTMAPPAIGYGEQRTREFYERLLGRLRETPGVEAATLVRHLPLNSLYGGGAAQRVVVPGCAPAPGEDTLPVKFNVVGRGYFDTMGTPILRGRDFGPGDGPASQSAVLINETMARTCWAGRDPVGSRITLVSPAGARRDGAVVGVVRNAKYMTLTEAPVPYLYLPFAQQFHGEMTVVVRVRGDERAMIAPFRRAIDAVDPAMPTLQITTLSEHLRLATFLERTLAATGLVLGALGLLLSVIGLHGVVTYLVERRTREIGIRMALGASAGDIRHHVFGQGWRLIGTGLAIGLALAAAAARLIATSVHGVRAADPLAFGAAAAVVASVALLALWLPARRASRTDPVVALRQQ